VSLSPQKREAFFLAEALHTHANSWCHCHHKNGKLFSCRGDPRSSYPQQLLTPQDREAFVSCRGFPYLVVSVISHQEQFLPAAVHANSNLVD